MLVKTQYSFTSKGVHMKTELSTSHQNTYRHRVAAFTSLLLALSIGTAHGAAAGMPWEAPLTTLLSSLTGPVAKLAGVAAVVLCGLGMAFSEGGSGMRKLLTIFFGLTIAFSATTFFLPLFGYAGGAAW